MNFNCNLNTIEARFLPFLFFLSIFGFSHYGEVVRKREPLMGTYGEIVCVPKGRISCQKSIEKAFQEIRDLEGILSYFDKDSEISLLNNSSGLVSVSEETFFILKRAKEISEKTEGAFDITVSPLLKLWGFYEKNLSQIPPQDLIEQTLNFVGMDKIILDEENKKVGFQKEGMSVDLGGIAKGYGVDRGVEVLRKMGIENAIVKLGGDLYCLGKGRDGKGWRIGIQDPLRPEKIVATLTLKNKGVATSGQYENFREIEKKRFGHILDPRRGYPVENEFLSVSVIADDCLTADALATAIFVLGKEKGEKILKEFEAEGVFITRTPQGMHIWISSGLKGKIDF